jgi:uncharacterized membrane protein
MRHLSRRLVIIVLAWLALTFLARDPLHYLIDHTQDSFGRFWPNRPWLLLHIIGGVVAIVIGPFQFVSRIRNRFPIIHRWSGRVYVSAIAVAGGSAFYLSFFAVEPGFGVALFAMATAWWLVTGAAFVAVRRRAFTVHRRWMIRSYIMTFAFVTFRLIVTLPILAPFGAYYVAVAAWASWLAPLLVAEVVFRRGQRAAKKPALATVS